MNKEYAGSFSNAFFDVLPMMGITELKAVDETECGKKIDAVGVVCIVGIVGDLAGNVIFAMDIEGAKRIASYMMGGMEVTEFDEITQSAISELGNMLAANACIGLSQTGLTVDISTPTLMHGTFTVSGSFAPVICLAMKVDELDFSIYISLERRS